jgi:Holliday junction resolvase
MNGSDHERRLCKILRDGGWHAHRAPTSGGGTDADLPDLSFGQGGLSFCLELKSSQEATIYVQERELFELKSYALAFGQRPILGTRWKGRRAFDIWNPTDLHRTDGGNYRIDRSDAPAFVFRDPEGACPDGLCPGDVDADDFAYEIGPVLRGEERD